MTPFLVSARKATHYIDSKAQNSSEVLQSLGGAKIILCTATHSKVMADCIDGTNFGCMMDNLPKLHTIFEFKMMKSTSQAYSGIHIHLCSKSIPGHRRMLRGRVPS